VRRYIGGKEQACTSEKKRERKSLLQKIFGEKTTRRGVGKEHPPVKEKKWPLNQEAPDRYGIKGL